MFFIVINSGKTVEPLGGVEVIYHTIRPAILLLPKKALTKIVLVGLKQAL